MLETRSSRQIGDDRVREATGRTWDEWEAELDARGAADLSHTKMAELLETEFKVSGWWAQAVTVDYERRKGRRAVGQTAATGFNIGVRRTLPLSLDAAWRLLTSPEGMRAWLGGAPAPEKGARYATPDGATGEVRVVQPGSHLRVTWHKPGWARPTTIQVRAIPAGEKTTISFHEEHLPGAAEREERRRHFTAALDALQHGLEQDA